MNVVWVIADNYLLDPGIDLTKLKEIGAFWGSWRTWRSCNTDNVICYDSEKAKELIASKFNTACNFYVQESLYHDLDESVNKTNIRAFGSQFYHDVEYADGIVGLFLAASSNDLVLMLGYDLTTDNHDNGYIHQAMLSFPDTQFVIIDHPDDPIEKITKLDNVTRDSLIAVLHMLG